MPSNRLPSRPATTSARRPGPLPAVAARRPGPPARPAGPARRPGPLAAIAARCPPSGPLPAVPCPPSLPAVQPALHQAVDSAHGTVLTAAAATRGQNSSLIRRLLAKQPVAIATSDDFCPPARLGAAQLVRCAAGSPRSCPATQPIHPRIAIGTRAPSVGAASPDRTTATAKTAAATA
ncbi:hypothetical protein GCM10027067_36700 [Pseudactinotalea suaedae]